MRNKKYTNEPTGLTGGALGSWRYRMMLKERNAQSKQFADSKKKFITIEDDHQFAFQQLCLVSATTVGDVKYNIALRLKGVHVDDVEVFYPYCKMARDDNLTLEALGMKNAEKLYYRLKPDV